MTAPLTVLFFGRPGCGKGTQMRLLTERLKQAGGHSVLPFEWAPLIRAFIQGNSKVQRRARFAIERGDRLPIFLAPSLWLPEFEQVTGNEHLLVDGLPRHRIEAELFDSLLRFYDRKPVYVVNLEVPEDVARERLLKRGTEEGRKDDLNEEPIQRRLDWFGSDTLPLLDYFNGRPYYRVVEIDGTPDREDVLEEIVRNLPI